MDNVTFINKNREVVPSTAEPNPVLIKYCEDLLEKAKSGEIVGLAGAILDKDRLGEFFTAGLVGGFSMIGALDCARHHLIVVARGEEDNPKAL